jgi:hypothetical protein
LARKLWHGGGPGFKSQPVHFRFVMDPDVLNGSDTENCVERKLESEAVCSSSS